MKKLLILASIACLMAIGGAASAQFHIICEWEVPASLDPGTGLPVENGSGSYHTYLMQNGAANDYFVVLYANNDGTAANNAVAGTPGPTGPGITPKSGVGKLSFTFGAVGGGLISTTPIAGFNTVNVPYAYGGFPNNFGGPNNNAFGTLAGTTGGGQWAQSGGATLFWNAADELNFVVPHASITHSADGTTAFVAGGNFFSGHFSFSSGGILARAQASYQDSGQQYTGACTIVPEGSALALVLPGLFPLGLLLRRRRMKVSA